MTNSESVRTVDITKCENFLRWMQETSKKEVNQHFEVVLKSATNDPLETMLAGLKRMAEVLEEIEENPISRITTNTTKIFQTGLLLGYSMSLASVNPEFQVLVEKLASLGENITPITAAKARK